MHSTAKQIRECCTLLEYLYLLLDSSRWSGVYRQFVSKDDVMMCLQVLSERLLFTQSYLLQNRGATAVPGATPQEPQPSCSPCSQQSVKCTTLGPENRTSSPELAEPFLPSLTALYQMLKRELIMHLPQTGHLLPHTKKKCVIVTSGDAYFAYTHTPLFQIYWVSLKTPNLCWSMIEL